MSRPSLAKLRYCEKKAFSEKIISFQKADFLNCIIYLGRNARMSSGQTLNARLVPAERDSMRFINSTSSVSDEDDNALDFVPVARSFNVMFEETYTLRCDYLIYKATTIAAKGNTKKDEELFLHYVHTTIWSKQALSPVVRS